MSVPKLPEPDEERELIIFNNDERRKLAQVRRRIKWLESRISVYMGADDSYDKAECSALIWLLKTALDGREWEFYHETTNTAPEDPSRDVPGPENLV